MIQVQILFPDLIEDQKKRSLPPIEGFLSPKSSEDQKNGLHHNLILLGGQKKLHPWTKCHNFFLE